jgi:hypothetical protein
MHDQEERIDKQLVVHSVKACWPFVLHSSGQLAAPSLANSMLYNACLMCTRRLT